MYKFSLTKTMRPKDAALLVNIVDSNRNVPVETIVSESALFAQICASHYSEV